MIEKTTKPRVRYRHGTGWFRVRPFWNFYDPALRRLRPTTVLVGPFPTIDEAVRNG